MTKRVGAQARMARAAAAAQNATLTGSASARIALTSAWAGASARASGPFRGCFAAAGAGFFAFGAGALGGFGAVAFGGAGLVACFFGIAFGAFAFVEARWRRIRPPRDLKLG